MKSTLGRMERFRYLALLVAYEHMVTPELTTAVQGGRDDTPHPDPKSGTRRLMLSELKTLLMGPSLDRFGEIVKVVRAMDGALGTGRQPFEDALMAFATACVRIGMKVAAEEPALAKRLAHPKPRKETTTT